MRRRSYFPFGEIFSDRDEIIVGPLSIGFSRRFMPGRSKLAAASDIREDVGPTSFQPGRTHRSAIAWQHGDLESAVTVKQGRVCSIQLHPFATDLEIRDLRSVF